MFVPADHQMDGPGSWPGAVGAGCRSECVSEATEGISVALRDGGSYPGPQRA
jgi:hypothetical protein